MSWPTASSHVCYWNGEGWTFRLPRRQDCNDETDSVSNMAALLSESTSHPTMMRITYIECWLHGWQATDEIAKLLISFLRSHRYIKYVEIRLENLKDSRHFDFVRRNGFMDSNDQCDYFFDSDLLVACLQAASENPILPSSGVEVRSELPGLASQFLYNDDVNRVEKLSQAMQGCLWLYSNFGFFPDNRQLDNMGDISNLIASLQWLQELRLHLPSSEFQNRLFACMEQMKMPKLRKLSMELEYYYEFPRRGHAFGTFLSSDGCHLESLRLNITFPCLYKESFVSWIDGLESGNSIKKLDVEFDFDGQLCFLDIIRILGQLIRNLLSAKVEELKLKIMSGNEASPVYLGHLQSTIWPELQRVRPSLKSLEICDSLINVDIGAENLKKFLKLTESLGHLNLDIDLGGFEERLLLLEDEYMFGGICQTMSEGFRFNNTLTSLKLPCWFFPPSLEDAEIVVLKESEFIGILLQGSILSSGEKKSTITKLELFGCYSNLPHMLRANSCSLVNLKVKCHRSCEGVQLVSAARDCKTLQKLFVDVHDDPDDPAYIVPGEGFWTDIAEYLPQLHLDSFTVDRSGDVTKYERVSARLIHGMERNCMLREASFRFRSWTVEQQVSFKATIDNLSFRNKVSKFCQQILTDYNVKVKNTNSSKALMKLVFPLLRTIENKRIALGMTTNNTCVAPGPLMVNLFYSTVLFAAFRGFQFFKFARENMAATSIQRTWKMYVASSKESV